MGKKNDQTIVGRKRCRPKKTFDQICLWLKISCETLDQKYCHPETHGPNLFSSEIIIGLKKADDAAVVKAEPGKLGVHTIDHFKQFIDDPWTLGKIAVNHALNDVFAMGANPKSALAIVGLPLSGSKLMKNDMSLLMRGASEGLEENGTVLVGGHTNEADEINIGFSAY